MKVQHRLFSGQSYPKKKKEMSRCLVGVVQRICTENERTARRRKKKKKKKKKEEKKGTETDAKLTISSNISYQRRRTSRDDRMSEICVTAAVYRSVDVHMVS